MIEDATLEREDALKTNLHDFPLQVCYLANL